MTILQFTDLHYNPEQTSAMLTIVEQEEPHLLALTGDISHWSDEAEDRKRLRNVQQFLEELNQTVSIAFCSGNHERWTRGSNTEDWALFCTDGQSRLMEADGKPWIITSFPWQDAGIISEQAITAEKLLLKQHPHAHRVWLHHDPPKRSSCGWNGLGYEGNIALEYVLQHYHPHYLLCGHIHCAPYTGGRAIEPYRKTICCNPGSSATRQDQYYTPVPAYIKIHAGEATWVKPI